MTGDGGAAAVEDSLRFGHPARAGRAAGEFAFARRDEPVPDRGQLPDISHDRRVLPHVGVHCRCEQDPAVAHHLFRDREQQCRKQVISDSGSELADDVGGCRRDHHEVGGSGKVNVLDAGSGSRTLPTCRTGQTRIGTGLREKLESNGVVREGAERLRADELAGGFGHHRLHVPAGLAKEPGDLQRLVGGDAAGDAQEDPKWRSGKWKV